MEYVAPMGLISLIVPVDATLVDLLGWSLGGDAWQQVRPSRLTALEASCRGATRAARQAISRNRNPDYDACSSRNALLWRDRILADLEAALEPWLTLLPVAGAKTETRNFRLVKGAERLFVRYGLSEPIAVDTVAGALGIPRRSHFHAFLKYLGVGPYAYLQLVRLHKLRERLIAATASTTTVTALASDLGFNQLGRLSAIYKKHFGEYPNETLKRV